MKYQFQIDYRGAAPIRDRWEDAVQDAVNQGYAIWVNPDEARLDTTQGAYIARIRNDSHQLRET